MGLFSRNKSKKKRKADQPKRSWLRAKPAKQRDPYEPSDSGLLRRALSLLLLAGIILGLGAGVYFGQRYMGSQVGQQRAVTPTIVLHDVPTWMGSARTDGIRQEIATQIGDNPMDRRSLSLAADTLRINPYIERVLRIERHRADRVDAYLVYREPVALVGARDGYHLIDRHGHRLPGVYPYHQLESLGLPAITGAAFAPPREGEAWRGDDLAAGLKVVQTIQTQPWAQQVLGIDVANYAGREDRTLPHLVMMTDRGVVRWGRAPGDERVYEPPVDRKLAMLRRVAESYGGRIDAGGGVVDVYTDTPLIHPASSLHQAAFGE